MIRKESAETQDCVSCQDVEVDNDEGLEEEMVFVPSAVSGSAGRREPLSFEYMSDQKCHEEGFKCHDIASILVEDDVEQHKINLCRSCFDLRRKKRIEGNPCQMEGGDG